MKQYMKLLSVLALGLAMGVVCRRCHTALLGGETGKRSSI